MTTRAASKLGDEFETQLQCPYLKSKMYILAELDSLGLNPSL
jgi:hypothetical protein